MANNRILWVDQLKCLAIFGVVLCHVYQWSEISDCIPLQVFGRFHTMLFMFLSGCFCIKSSEDFSFHSFRSFLKKKFTRILIPFFIIGGAFSFVNNGSLIPLLLGSIPHYWFMVSVFCCMLLSYAFFAVTKRFGTRTSLLLGALYCLLIMVLWYSGPLRPLPYSFMTISSLPYFLLGCFYRKYDVLQRLFANDILYAISILLAIVFTIYRNSIPQNLAGYFYIIVLLRLFKENEAKIGCKIARIGTYSLEIYMLHFFFIPNLSSWKDMLLCSTSLNGNIICSLAVFSLISVCIMALSILFGSILKGSPVSKWIIGA